MNKVILIGRLGRDPELRRTQGGDAVCNFSLATDEVWGDKKHTEWHQIVCWRKTAEVAAQYLTKGRGVAVVGTLRTEKWTDRDGGKRTTTKIHADRVEFLPDGGSQRTEGSAEKKPSGFVDPGADDIPF